MKAEPTETFSVKHINKERGLPSNRVPSIFHDDHGFLWAATYNGLARYNGSNFSYFKKIPGNNDSLKTSQVNAVYVSTSPRWNQEQSPTYTAWVGLNNKQGIQIIKNGKVTKSLLAGYSININGLQPIGDDTLQIISDSQVFILNKKTHKIKTQYDFDAHVHSALKIGDNMLVGTVQGLRVQGNANKPIKYLKDIRVRDMAKLEDKILFGTDQGLYIYDKNILNQRFKNKIIRQTKVFKNTLFLGTTEGVFECPIDLVEEQYCRQYLKNKTITNIDWDPITNIVWASTTNSGIYQLASNRHVISSFTAKSGVQYHSYLEFNEEQWIASDGDGLWRKNNQGSWHNYNDSLIGSNRILTMKKDPLDRLWLGHYKGVTIFNPSNDSTKRLLSNQIILTILIEGGIVYIGTDSDGLHQYTIDGQFIKKINKSSGLISTSIISLASAQSGGVWAGTEQGVYHISESGISRVGKEFTIWSIQEISPDTLLIGTEGDGLLIYKNNILSKQYTTENSNLKSNTITDIITNNHTGQEEIVLSTLQGIAINDNINSPWFKTVSKKDGLYPSELLRHALSYTPENKLVIAGADGWSKLGKSNDLNTIPSYPVHLTKEIPKEIPFGQPVVVAFNGINHADNYPSSYYYSLNNSAMKELDGSNSIVFDALNPGEHVLRIRALSSTGAGIREINFSITAPWSLSFYAWLSLAIAVLTVALLLIQYKWLNKSIVRLRNKNEGLEIELDEILKEDTESFLLNNNHLPLELPKTTSQIGLAEQIKLSVEMTPTLKNLITVKYAVDEKQTVKMPVDTKSQLWSMFSIAINQLMSGNQKLVTYIRSNDKEFDLKLVFKNKSVDIFKEVESLFRSHYELTNIKLRTSSTSAGAVMSLKVDKSIFVH